MIEENQVAVGSGTFDFRTIVSMDLAEPGWPQVGQGFLLNSNVGATCDHVMMKEGKTRGSLIAGFPLHELRTATLISKVLAFPKNYPRSTLVPDALVSIRPDETAKADGRDRIKDVDASMRNLATQGFRSVRGERTLQGPDVIAFSFNPSEAFSTGQLTAISMSDVIFPSMDRTPIGLPSANKLEWTIGAGLEIAQQDAPQSLVVTHQGSVRSVVVPEITAERERYLHFGSLTQILYSIDLSGAVAFRYMSMDMDGLNEGHSGLPMLDAETGQVIGVFSSKSAIDETRYFEPLSFVPNSFDPAKY